MRGEKKTPTQPDKAATPREPAASKLKTKK